MPDTVHENEMHWIPLDFEIKICCIAMKDETTTLGYRNITLFILTWSQSFCYVRETNGRTETDTLTHNFFSWLYQAVLSSRPHLTLSLFSKGEYSTGDPQWGAQSLAGTPVTASWDWLKIDSLRLSVSHVGICIYHFITPTNFWSTMILLPLIFTCASCEKNIWLTARSRVNM